MPLPSHHLKSLTRVKGPAKGPSRPRNPSPKGPGPSPEPRRARATPPHVWRTRGRRQHTLALARASSPRLVLPEPQARLPATHRIQLLLHRLSEGLVLLIQISAHKSLDDSLFLRHVWCCEWGWTSELQTRFGTGGEARALALGAMISDSFWLSGEMRLAR